MAGITLTHASVNSGTAVDLHGVSITYSWKNLTNIDPVEGQFDTVESNFGGFENPKVSISGHFDVEDISSNDLTQELLTEFATLRSTTPITLSVTTGASNTALKGRPSGGYETDGTMTLTNTIKIQINIFNILIDTSSDQGRFWNYSIVCTETV